MRELLHPRSIAVIGASDDPVKLSGRPVDYMTRLGYAGRLLPVNATRDEVQGLPAYRSVTDIDGDIDLAIVLVPAGQAIAAVRECGKRGVKVVIVGAAGFAETGAEGAALQEELRQVANDVGVRVLGPNCLGMIGVADQAFPTFSTALDELSDLRSGPVAFVSQSGAFGSFIFSAAQQAGIGISHYVNTGNEVDLSVSEVMGMFLEAEETHVVLAYFEGVTDGTQLLDVARRAEELDKPIVACKVGRSEAGARAAASHTASLAGEDEVFDAVVRQHGIVRVDGTESMLDAAQVFATGRRATGRRLTVLTSSGGAGVLMSDAAEARGLQVTPWDEPWQAKMASILPAYGTTTNPIDLTGTLAAEPELLRRSLDIAVEHPETDLIAVLLGNSDASADQLVDAIAASGQSTRRPIVVVWTGGNGRAGDRLRRLGIPCFTDAGRAAAALGLLTDHSLRTELEVPTRPDDIDVRAARRIVAVARSQGRVQLDEAESTRLIAAYGVPTAAQLVATTADDAVRALDELGGPVALKVLSTKIAHKSDVGGVVLGLTDADAVREAADQVLSIAVRQGDPDAHLLVQQMAEPGVELIAGLKHDPVFGPVVVVGLGGILVEVLGDSRVAVAPLSSGTAHGLLTGLRGAAMFGPVRGRPARDLTTAADIVSRLSWLANDLAGNLAELDVNPLILGPEGASTVAVDCLALLSDPTRAEE